MKNEAETQHGQSYVENTPVVNQQQQEQQQQQHAPQYAYYYPQQQTQSNGYNGYCYVPVDATPMMEYDGYAPITTENNQLNYVTFNYNMRANRYMNQHNNGGNINTHGQQQYPKSIYHNKQSTKHYNYSQSRSGNNNTNHGNNGKKQTKGSGSNNNDQGGKKYCKNINISSIAELKEALLDNFTQKNQHGAVMRLTNKNCNSKVFNMSKTNSRKNNDVRSWDRFYEIKVEDTSLVSKNKTEKLPNFLNLLTVGREPLVQGVELKSYKDIKNEFTEIENQLAVCKNKTLGESMHTAISPKKSFALNNRRNAGENNTKSFNQISKDLLFDALSINDNSTTANRKDATSKENKQDIQNESPSKSFGKQIQFQNSITFLSPTKKRAETPPVSPTRNLVSSNNYNTRESLKEPIVKIESLGDTEITHQDLSANANRDDPDMSIGSLDTSMRNADGFSFVDLSFDGKAMDKSDIFRMVDSFTIDEPNNTSFVSSKRRVLKNEPVLKNILSQDVSAIH